MLEAAEILPGCGAWLVVVVVMWFVVDRVERKRHNNRYW